MQQAIDFFGDQAKLYYVYIGNSTKKEQTKQDVKSLLEQHVQWRSFPIDKSDFIKQSSQKIDNDKTIQYIDKSNDILDKYNAPRYVHLLIVDIPSTYAFECIRCLDHYFFGWVHLVLSGEFDPNLNKRLLKWLQLHNYIQVNKKGDFIHQSLIEGDYYFRNDYTKMINVQFLDHDKQEHKTVLEVTSPYWPQDVGYIDMENNSVHWQRLHVGRLLCHGIDYGNGNVWHRDKRKNLLFIGANDMSEIDQYVGQYKHALFIEADSKIYQEMLRNLNRANTQYHTKYVGVNSLITDEDNKEYTFNIFSNHGASSSIYNANIQNWKWNHVKKLGETTLTSCTIKTLLDTNQWSFSEFDLVLDVQGAELQVLKGFGPYLKHVRQIKCEVSKREFYQGGVLFPELDEFLRLNGFNLQGSYSSVPDHGDVIYIAQ